MALWRALRGEPQTKHREMARAASTQSEGRLCSVNQPCRLHWCWAHTWAGRRKRLPRAAILTAGLPPRLGTKSKTTEGRPRIGWYAVGGWVGGSRTQDNSPPRASGPMTAASQAAPSSEALPGHPDGGRRVNGEVRQAPERWKPRSLSCRAGSRLRRRNHPPGHGSPPPDRRSSGALGGPPRPPERPQGHGGPSVSHKKP